MSHFEKKVQLNKIIESQLPEFLVADFPKAVEFFKQYYISQEAQGGNVDLIDNLDRYIKLDNLIPEVVVAKATLSSDISASDTTINVSSTKGYPEDYGLLKIGNEIITYTGKTDTSFTGCIRGFSGVTGFDDSTKAYFVDTNRQSVVFEDTVAESHTAQAEIQNLSALFLQNFYKQLKKTFTPGIEEETFVSDLNVANFIKHSRNFYQSKGIEESVIILFKVLYGVTAKVIDLEGRLIKPSSADYIRREVVVAEQISGDPFALKGQTIFRSNDLSTNASVSEVEIFTREGLSFYKIDLFIGYNDRDLVEGTFDVPGFSRVLEPVSAGSSVIAVDSTIGFGQTGSVVTGDLTIEYTSKSVNQFFGCTGITSSITLGAPLRADETVFGYENGDPDKKCELRITGVLADFESIDDIPLMEKFERLSVRNIGDVIYNPSGEQTYKEVFSNSWIYNTSTRFEVKNIQGTLFELYLEPEESTLKVGDTVDILFGNSVTTVVSSNATVDAISGTSVTLGNISGFTPLPNQNYSFRRNLVKSTSATTQIKEGNNVYVANALNVYTDDADTFGYVASNSLPGYEILDEIVESVSPDGTVSNLGGYSTYFQNYSTVKFSSSVRFIDGDEIVYTAENQFSGLVSGESYFVKRVGSNEIQLFASKAQLKGNEFVRIGPNNNAGQHFFTLKRHEDKALSANSILRKIPLGQSLAQHSEVTRNIGNVGVLVDGTEISSPESRDRIYYGPLEEFEVVNSGRDYDVINPPEITVSVGKGSTVGLVTALVEPVVVGSVKQVFVDPQTFDVEDVLSVSLTGGNGEGCVLEPVVGTRFREVEFDSRALTLGGGVDINEETITFFEPHNFVDGQTVIYNHNNNDPISIGNAYDINNGITGTLISGDEYVVKVVNTTTVKLHLSESDALNEGVGINTIGLSTATSASGIHKFRTLSKKNLREVNVLNPGSGYAHRKLRVKPAGISTYFNTITFKNHGFETGETVKYSGTGTQLGGLNTTDSYQILKIDSDTFKVINVGVGATDTTDSVRNKVVDLTDAGSGYHIFQYPPIEITANVSFGGTSGSFTFTPIITGEMTHAYMYESGVGYGSTILNLHQKPLISISEGKNAQLAPIVSNGRIVAVQVLNGGSGYVSTPDLMVEDTSTPGGTGAILRPVITNEKITDVIVINQGIGYDGNSTSVYIKSRGFGAKFDTRVRYLDVNDAERFAAFSRTQTKKIFSNLYKNEKSDSLVYGIFGYSEDLAQQLEPLDGNHSPIVGWAYDGNPIYGPFGYGDPENIQSGVRLLKVGYELDSNSVQDRPNFTAGFFVDDYRYTGIGDLDKHNGRFCKTPEFPDGIYAYFVGVTTSQTSPNFEPQYPYFVGNTYRSEVLEENFVLDQSFDFNNSTLSRNTLPYNVNQDRADYDFINEGYEFADQIAIVEAVTQGDIDRVDIVEGGVNYKIGDRINFTSEDTNGEGLRAEVSEIVGAAVTSLNTTLETYESVVFEWINDKQVAAYTENGFDLLDNDSVLVSGLSTSVVSLNGTVRIGINSETVSLAGTMSAYTSTPFGKYEDIFISKQFVNVSAGNTMRIVSSGGDEEVTILNDFKNGVVRVKRHGTSGIAHTLGCRLEPFVDTAILPVRTKQFNSKRNDVVYFNAQQSVGIGATAGGSVTKTYNVGTTPVSVTIPCQQIHIPNHPFKTGQKVNLSMTTKPGVLNIIVGDDDQNNNTFNIPGTVSELYVIDKGRNFIGLTTQVGLTTAGNGLFFYNEGSDDNEYRFDTTFETLTGDISKITTKISCGSTHGLEEGDTVKLNVVPSTIVGIGTTAACTLEFNEDKQLLLVNPIGITSAAFTPSTNRITIPNHGYKTGDKLFYESVEAPGGLVSDQCYYVIRDTSNTFRLAETLYESNPLTEKQVNIVGTGDTNHKFSLVNPQINVVRNSDLQFNMQDTSLNGYELKIYRENEFINEYVSSYDSRDFNVVGVGSVGIGSASDASLTIKHSENVPSKLYYALEKGGYISTADTNVIHFSEINYVNSEYNGTYNVFGVGTTTFNVSPSQMPIVLDYVPSQCDTLQYTTKSSTALNGSIGNVRVISKGFNYEKLPKFIDVTSSNGNNANIVAISTSIGRVKSVRFRNIGYDYPSDKTLRPEAVVPPLVRIDNLDTIKEFDIKFAGRRYLSDPDLILWNDTTNKVVDTSSLIAHAPNGAIAEIEQLAPLSGLDSEPHRVVAINNSNGVGIVSMTTSPFGIATCTLTTPILGFSTALFAAGDTVFVEGIEMVPGSGTGYNSEDYDYKFFQVLSYNDTSPAVLTFKVVGEDGVGLTTNPGIAKTFQSGYATIINKNDYPDIGVIQERSEFVENEALFVNTGTGFFKTDLTVALVRDDYIKINGSYNVVKGDRIKGIVSGTIASVTEVDRKRAKFNIGYSGKLDIGWRNDIGKISEDYQVIPDNDYYQNLSYSIKSPITWDEFSSPVNRTIHPAGLKNFADVGITSVGSSRVGLAGSTTSIVVLDVVSERRVDTINNFDNAIDDDPRLSGITSFLQSNSLQLQNRKLTDFTECRTNRVLIHDDISSKFSSRGFQDTFVELDTVGENDRHVRYLIQITDPDSGDIQVSEVVFQSTVSDTFVFEKYSAVSKDKLGNFRANVESDGTRSFIFEPIDAYDTDHDIKILKKSYLFTQSPGTSAASGTESFGSIDLRSSFVSVGNTLGIATNTTIAEFDVNDFNGAFASIEIDERFGTDTEYLEVSLDFDGDNTYISEYYFDTTTQSFSASQTGIVSAIYDANAGIVSLTAYNSGISSTPYDVRSNIVGFGTTTAGIGTYRFLLNSQPAGTEKSARLESTLGFGPGPITLGTFNIFDISSSSSIVRVSMGETSAIHQVTVMANDQDLETFVVGGPFAGANTTSGLGTFGTTISGNDYFLKFYPDTGYDVEAQSFNEVFYRESDFDNQANPLEYGPTNQLLYLSAFDGLNGLRANRTKFRLTHQSNPIYAKVFNPADTTSIDYTTGLFTYPNHFFNTGEELLYTPKSTFTGVGQTSMGIGQTANYAGIVTDKLPEKVYPIAVTPDSFKLSTKPEYARAGIFVTFTDAGLGNAHELEFTKKLSKTVIALDGIVQQPVTFTPISHTLNFNNGGINAGIATFNISGISSIQPRDLLKIDDEYMKVVEVGFSTNVNGQLLGPINGIIAAGTAATHPTVSVVRGIVGSAATSHTDGAEVRIHRGSFNIVDNDLYFVDPPKGNSRARRDESNLPYVRAQYSGRTFLRSNYETNMVFDDISDSFSGIGKTYTATVGGANTVGIEPGNGILFINGVFQTPSTENNAGNNYIFEQDTAAGISSVVFTGITSTDGSYIESEFDINQNQIPRGGLIVSLGSTPGLGYAPLVGAKVKAEKNSSGALTSIVGINTWTRPVAVSTASYNQFSGILELETSAPHNLKNGDRVKLEGLEFSCASQHAGVTTTTFPDHDRSFDILTIVNANELTVNVGPSSIAHVYENSGQVYEHFSLNFGSGYRGPVSIAVTDLAYDHKFIRSVTGGITEYYGRSFTPTAAKYTSRTGVLQLTIINHGLTTSDTITIADDALIFTCSDDDHFTEQSYPRSTDPASGATLAITAVTDNTITVNVGPGGGAGTGAVVSATVGAGGTLAFTIDNPGSGYVNPVIEIPDPVYENMEVVGVSRLGVGATTETGKNLLLNLSVGAAGTANNNVGIGSTLFLIDEFQIARNGYGFKPGDILEVVGLVTAKDYTSPIEPFQIEITETFQDFFSSWSFGEMDYIDSVKGYQNGSRKRFPLFYNGELLSFEIDANDPLSGAIDLDSVLLIFINGVLQTPGYAYQFTGGTSFVFQEAPKEDDKVDIFFYIGQEGVDVGITTVTETLKVGDDLFVKKHPLFQQTVDQLTSRPIAEIAGSDVVETPVYTGPGIEQTIFRPFDWTKQKKDKFIKGDVVYKTRDQLEPKIFPTAKIIKDVTPSDTEIFVDNAQFFDYDEIIYDLNVGTFKFDAFMVDHSEPVSAAFTATVSAAGTIASISITDPGSGYSGSSIDVKFAAPKVVGVGIGTTAAATATVSAAGTITSVSLTNIGLGYTTAVAPNVIAEIPTATYESIGNAQNVQGFTGIITGISETTGTGGQKAIKFNFVGLKDYGVDGESQVASDVLDLLAGYPVTIFDTKVGNGAVSVYDSDTAVVGVGTTFLDNIYIVDSITSLASNGEIICNVTSGTNLSGIASTGNFDEDFAGLTTSLGTLSWGRIYNFDERPAGAIGVGVSGLTVDSGLSTFPTIQRRGNFGQGKTGAVRSRKPLADANAVLDNDLPFYS